LWNDCVSSTTTNIVIICGDKARPTIENINKGIDLIEQGYGSVQMFSMGFCVLHKSLINKIGWMDERINSGYQHHDFMLRHKYYDIAYYESSEIDYVNLPSSPHFWSGDNGFYNKKWKEVRYEYNKRLLDDIDYAHPLIYDEEVDFMIYKDTVILTGNDEIYHRDMLNQQDEIIVSRYE